MKKLKFWHGVLALVAGIALAHLDSVNKANEAPAKQEMEVTPEIHSIQQVTFSIPKYTDYDGVTELPSYGKVHPSTRLPDANMAGKHDVPLWYKWEVKGTLVTAKVAADGTITGSFANINSDLRHETLTFTPQVENGVLTHVIMTIKK